MKHKLLSSALLSFFILGLTIVRAQTISPDRIDRPIAFDIFDLSKAPMLEPGIIDRSWQERVIPNKEGFLEEFNVPSTWTGPDPVLQDFNMAERATATIVKNFAGMSNTSGVAPPDTQGDVSPEYYMQMVNLSFQIFDKNGQSLYGPALSSTLWSGFTGPWTGTNDGDPIVLYDQYADRWIATQFSLPNYPSGPFYELIAISQTNDPRGTWYRYAYEFADMPDYPKFGVWPDGYYMTINRFAPPRLTFAGGAVSVFNRADMIAGVSNAPSITFNLSTSYGSLLPADLDGQLPPAGSPNYLANMGTNSLRIWKATIDWANTGNSTLQLTQTLTTSSFSYSGITINQPGTSQTLDALASRLMYRLQYRNFGSYEVMMTNHTVNANGTGQAGVRWYELRKYPGQSWTIYQQGTYAPNDGVDRWMASVAMNANGDIGIGYSASGSSVYPSVRFAGRTATAALGVLDVPEVIIHAGASSQTGVNRWGDYSMMSVDPVNDLTFWYTNEYSSGGWNWKTKIASLNISQSTGNPPVANFSGNPTSLSTGGTVAFTDLSTNVPTSWAWTFEGGTPGTSDVKNPVITYNTPGTFAVTLTASNDFGTNTRTVAGYITVIAGQVPVADFVAAPLITSVGQNVSFTDLSTNSPTSWNWTFNGGTPATSSAQNPTVTYSLPGDYSVSLIASNVNGSSSTTTKINYIHVDPVSYCISTSTSTSFTDYIVSTSFNGSTYSNGASNYYLFPNGPNLAPGGTVNFVLTPSSTSRKESWRIWIDYNNNGLFTDAGEQVFSVNNARKVVTGRFIIPTGANGSSRMRISMKYGGAPSPCETFTNGEVEDYPVTFNTLAAPVADRTNAVALSLQLYPNPVNDILNIKVSSPYEKVNVKVYSVLGVILQDFNIPTGLATLDVSQFKNGTYYIGVEDGSETTLKKFVKD